MNAVSLIVSELNAAGQTMRECAAGVPCNLAADLRRHDAEEIRRDREAEQIHQTAIGLMHTDCNPVTGENIAEMLREKFADDVLGEQLATLLADDTGPVALFLKDLSRTYWAAQADTMAQALHDRQHIPAPRRVAGAKPFLDLM